MPKTEQTACGDAPGRRVCLETQLRSWLARFPSLCSAWQLRSSAGELTQRSCEAIPVGTAFVAPPALRVRGLRGLKAQDLRLEGLGGAAFGTSGQLGPRISARPGTGAAVFVNFVIKKGLLRDGAQPIWPALTLELSEQRSSKGLRHLLLGLLHRRALQISSSLGLRGGIGAHVHRWQAVSQDTGR